MSGTVEISTLGSNFDTILGVYTGSALTNLVVVASSDDVSTNQPTSFVTFKALAYTPYHIAVDGYDGEPGDIQLHISMKDLIWLGLPKPMASGGYQLTLTAPTGRQYGLDTSTNLIDWTTLLGPAFTESGTFQFQDTNSISGQKFYRAIIDP